MDLTKYKENPKTAYLAVEMERLVAEEAELLELSKGELAAVAREDLAKLDEQKAAIAAEMDKILAQEAKEEESPNEAVLEVRAGVGGEEAALFAAELAHMYRAYAERCGWSVRVL